ncbi:unnamed protein product [Mytilus edulis]|uniref:B box-type domain-containing protein n=1 Tax=Mytilus edulis TaxID=6550 RepID=A0A8S3TN33_MYTED|nr:unnamed protein product [Mytilus edulis]
MDHKLISVEDYRKIEHVAVSFTCNNHNKKLKWFCKSHDQALCVVCLPTEHRSCSDVISIAAVAATNARQSTAMSDTGGHRGCSILPNGHLLFANYTNEQKTYVKLDAKVEVFDITGKKLRTLAAEVKDYISYISASTDNIFCSNFVNSHIYCYDIEGIKVWKFRNDSLQNPLGVANDRSGNVFVVGYGSTYLILIQHDGKSFKNLLNFDKASSPSVVCYDNDKILY